MHKTISTLKWLLFVFFFLTIVMGVIQYAWWYWIAPPYTGEYNTDAYFTGAILLAIYVLTIIIWMYIKNISLKGLMLVLSIFWLLVNAAYVNWFKPFLFDSITCNGTTYFATSHVDYWFYSWSYDQITKRSGLRYKEIY